MSPSAQTAPSTWYTSLVEPRRIAVVGASSDPAKGGLLRHLVRLGFGGDVVPVNPRGGVIDGLAVATSVSSIDGHVDLALIVVPARGVPAAVRDCAEAGVTVAYVMSSGFGELGDEGRQLEREAVAEAARSGLRLLGPNTNGMICARTSLVASIMTTVADLDAAPPVSEVALISQSGAIGAFALSGCREAGLPVGLYFSTGNEADVGFEELLACAVDDPQVSVVLTYVEGLRDGAAFVAAAQRARALGKTIVMLKVGVTEAGARASASHTAAMAGADAVYDGVLRQLGVLRAADLRELVEVAKVVAAPRRPKGRRVGVVTISGGLAVMATDAAVTRDLALPEWSPAGAATLAALLPAYLDVHNPLDTSGVLADDPDLLRSLLDTACRDSEIDVVLLCLGGSRAREDSIGRTLIECVPGLAKPVMVVWVGGDGRLSERLASARIPCFASVESALAVLDVAMPVRRAVPDRVTDPAQVNGETALALSRKLIEAARDRDQAVLDEVDGKAILRAWGIPTAAEVVVDKAVAVAEAVMDLRFPLVAKLRSARLLHKSDVGGVILGLADVVSAATAVERLLEVADGLGLDDAGVVLQEQVDVGVELILGCSVDPTFGQVVTVGIGGVMAEVAPDVRVRLPELGQADVEDALGGLRGQRLLNGFRGAAPVPRADLADVTVAFARMASALEPWIAEIDVNPLVTERAGGALLAVDALMVVR